jgi:outer membrane protein assembly factor BamB
MESGPGFGWRARAIVLVSSALAFISSLALSGRQQTTSPLPSGQLSFGHFTARFVPDPSTPLRAGGTFTLEGEDWPTLKGDWTADSGQIELLIPKLLVPQGEEGCDGPGRYRFRVAGRRLTFDLVSDGCDARRLVLDRSTWAPAEEPRVVAARRIRLTVANRTALGAKAGDGAGSWPSFRGPRASGIADKQGLPDTWNVKTGEHILWRTPIPGLAHSSPIIWGDRIFVTSAISSRPNATFRPGLYGDGDASDDLSRQRWVMYAIDKRTGKTLWERVVYEGEPLNKRHIKSTYASSSPATDGRVVVAWFGSQGVYAYDLDGTLRWKVDLGDVDMGAYNIPTIEWGPASSPIIWNGLVILQCDTQADSFVIALNAETGKTVWKTERKELPSWGTPTVAMTSAGPELVTNASNFIRGYDPRTGKELWKLGHSSKITAPTPIATDDFLVVASGRAPERPIFVIRAGARGDLTLPEGETRSQSIVWSRTGRGSYMPTPLIYGDLLYVLGNNGVFDAYNLKTGDEIYRQRLPEIGSGYSASPVAADGKIYLSNEDGEMLVVAGGPTFRHIATNSLGEPLMATPALSEGVMYVRSSRTLFAIGSNR